MRAYKCDRCGVYFEDVSKLLYIFDEPDINRGIGEGKHLCQDCQDKLEKWFYNESEDKSKDEN